MNVRINSRARWVDTGVMLVASTPYRLATTGRWKDANIETDAAGYESANIFQRLTERWRRMPGARWFALIGAIDQRPETQFLIGKGCLYEATVNGRLTCFANDLPRFYFNNSGSVLLTVDVVAPQ
jgi:hypothetical protein